MKCIFEMHYYYKLFVYYANKKDAQIIKYSWVQRKRERVCVLFVQCTPQMNVCAW